MRDPAIDRGQHLLWRGARALQQPMCWEKQLQHQLSDLSCEQAQEVAFSCLGSIYPLNSPSLPQVSLRKLTRKQDLLRSNQGHNEKPPKSPAINKAYMQLSSSLSLLHPNELFHMVVDRLKVKFHFWCQSIHTRDLKSTLITEELH